MSMVRMAFVVAALVLAGGCYRWVPTEQAAVPPGTQLRARLTDAGTAEIRTYFGPGLLTVEGPLVAWDRTGLSLLTETSVRRPGFPPTTMTDTIQLLPNHLAGVDMQELDGKRTAGLSAGLLGGVVLAILATRTLGGETDPGEGVDPPPEATILFSIPLRIGGR
jgi:uncharacterized protein YbjT (DUF2867 family)